MCILPVTSNEVTKTFNLVLVGKKNIFLGHHAMTSYTNYSTECQTIVWACRESWIMVSQSLAYLLPGQKQHQQMNPPESQVFKRLSCRAEFCTVNARVCILCDESRALGSCHSHALLTDSRMQ